MFDIKKFKLNLKPLGNNVFNNILSTNQNLLGNTNSKLVNNKIVNKKILYYDKKANAPPLSFVKKVYSRIPDDETVPVVFQTKRQYLQEYIKNQERKNGVVFTKQEKERYLNNELKEMRPIVSRFTTYHNPYMPPRVVYFTDNKVSKQQFQHNAHHEFGHELYERQARVRQNWNMRVTPQTSPTNYGKTSADEDFAESYALYKANKLRDGNRANVFNNIKVDEVSKDSQIYLSKSKKGSAFKQMAYVNEGQPKKIFLGHESKRVDFNNDANLRHLAAVINHEELHNVLQRDVNTDASEKLDNITSKTIFMHSKTKPEILAHFGEEPKEVVFPSEYKKQEALRPKSVYLNPDNQILIDDESQNYENEGPDEYIWGHKWVEDEYGQPKRISFKVPTRNLGSNKKSVKMKDVEDIVAAPFLTKEEKTQRLEEIGATRGIVRMAEMKLSQNRRRRIGGNQW